MKLVLGFFCSLLLLASCGSTPTTPVVTTPTEDRTVATPTYGSGKMQIEIFADFQCPACISFNETLSPIFEEYASQGKMTITYRQFPLNMHKNARGDALAALCSAEQGGYLDYKKGLYALEKSKSGKAISDAERVSLATTLSLDTSKFEKCLASKAYDKQVTSDIAFGDSRGVSGTPTIFLDGIKLDMSLFRDIAGIRSFLESRMK